MNFQWKFLQMSDFNVAFTECVGCGFVQMVVYSTMYLYHSLYRMRRWLVSDLQMMSSHDWPLHSTRTAGEFWTEGTIVQLSLPLHLPLFPVLPPSSWYDVDYSVASSLRFGQCLGCDFAEKSCFSYGWVGDLWPLSFFTFCWHVG